MTEQETQSTAESRPVQVERVVERVIIRRGGTGAVIMAVILSSFVTGVAVMTAAKWTPFASKIFHVANPESRYIGLDQRLVDLTADTKALKDAAPGVAEKAAGAHAVALTLVAKRLSSALETNKPFSADYDMLAVLAQGDKDLTTAATVLGPLAQVGIPTIADLRASFGSVRNAIFSSMATPAPTTEASSWLSPVTAFVAYVRFATHTEPPAASGTVALLSKVDARLGKRDVAGAVEELANLSESQSDKAAEWIASAQTRLAAERAISDLLSLSQARLASK